MTDGRRDELKGAVFDVELLECGNGEELIRQKLQFVIPLQGEDLQRWQSPNLGRKALEQVARQIKAFQVVKGTNSSRHFLNEVEI